MIVDLRSDNPNYAIGFMSLNDLGCWCNLCYAV